VEDLREGAPNLADNAELFYSGHGGLLSRQDLSVALIAVRDEAAEDDA